MGTSLVLDRVELNLALLVSNLELGVELLCEALLRSSFFRGTAITIELNLLDGRVGSILLIFKHDRALFSCSRLTCVDLLKGERLAVSVLKASLHLGSGG